MSRNLLPEALTHPPCSPDKPETTAFASVSFVAATPKQSHLLTIIMNSRAMTAQPLFDVFDATLGAILADPDHSIPAGEQQRLRDVMKQVRPKYQKTVHQRNNMLHAKWYIGWSSTDQEDFGNFDVQKLHISQSGLSFADNPRTLSKLQIETEKCRELHHTLSAIGHSLKLGIFGQVANLFPQQVFYQTGGQWKPRGTFHG
jgi:hypothetical protein